MTIEITESALASVGDTTVRRALPRRQRRMVGAWCFADHMGPVEATPTHSLDVGPHPHCGLQTVTWLTQGQILHHDSLGSVQLIAPGQLNLMTAGRGVSHSEEATGSYAGPVEGIQLWMAQPEATRDGDPAFEHHAELPHGRPARRPRNRARRDARRRHESGEDRFADGRRRAGARRTEPVPVDATFEHGLIVLDGTVVVDGATLTPGHLGYLGPGRDELLLEPEGTARVMLLGGEPFPEPIVMWWNYVLRTRAEATTAHHAWLADDGRFGTVESDLDRVVVDLPPWA
ncbi:pirin family protein [Aquihabitans daechungensis]|uniref:pirin family protein n=1 Tax=Aquihabitans daechungensis TaxID=1052257 RepID=UPI003BA3C95E